MKFTRAFKSLKTICAATVVAAAFAFAPAQAQNNDDSGEAYANTNLRDLTQTSIMMDAYDLKNTKYVDEYAKVFYCELYKTKFKEDFEWNNIRQEILGRINNKKEYYRVLYQFSGPVNLGRYNFETQDFPFEKGSAIVNVGYMVMQEPMHKRLAGAQLSECFGKNDTLEFYKSFQVRLSEPLTIDRLKMPTGPAQVLLDKMQAQNNANREVYLRYRVKLVTAMKSNPNKQSSDRGTFVAQLTAVDVFLDPELTQFVSNISLNKE